jgi:shikimate dehydrogenase
VPTEVPEPSPGFLPGLTGFVPGPSTGPARPSAATSVVGVIGDPVAHSLSPLLHNTAFAELGIDWVSVAFRVRPGDAADALEGARAMGIRGLSVTMPHKDAAAELVDHRSPVAERLGAVNCVVFEPGEDRASLGENTDGAGLVSALRRGAHFEPEGGRCLVVGAGGAARAVVAALADSGAAEVVVVNRSPERGSAAAALAGPVGRVGVPGDATACDLVVNATPIGMAGTTGAEAGAWPVDPHLLRPGQLVIDLVYEPDRTPWLQAAGYRGAEVGNGRGMLVHQAALQVALWTGLEAPVEAMWAAIAH